MISFNRILRSLCLLAAAVSLFTGCSDDEPVEQLRGYGYVQFHLYKSASYTKAQNQLDYLYDAAKVKLSLRTGNNDILTPTVTVTSPDKSLAELGMQTDKFKLTAGDYTLMSFQILDALDNPVYTGDAPEDAVIHVVAGGLVSKDLLVDVVERGKVNFTFTKIVPQVKGSGVDTYPMYMMKSADVTVRNKTTHEQVKITNLATAYEFVFANEDNNYVTEICRTDSLVTLKGGEWEVIAFTTYFDRSRKVYETCTDVAQNSFKVNDNQQSDASVPITLNLSAEYVKDAIALKKIWEALDGPNWKVKWNFDCDVDIWLAQTGVQILENGRVASLDLTGTGAKGDMPAEIGQLTELRMLLMGSETYSEATTPFGNGNLYNAEEVEREMNLKERFTRTYMCNSDRLDCFSDEMRLAFEIDGVELHKSSTPLKSYPAPGGNINYATGITSLPPEINNLKNLRYLFAGYGPMKTIPEDLSGLTSLTDVEFFYMPEMTEFPSGLATLPKVQMMVFGCNYGVPAEALYEGLKELSAGAAAASIQGLYVPMQKLEKVPDLRNMVKLALLNIQSCGVKEFEAPFGKKHYFNSFYADNNELSSLPLDENGYFLGVDSNTEVLNFSNNKFTSMPDFLEASSIFAFGTLNFSNNQISSFDNFNGSGWRGMNCEIMNLSFNKLTEFPVEIAKSGSKTSYLQLQGNCIEKVDEEAMNGEELWRISAIDLSYNKLTSLPDNFNARTFQYLGGLDLSYNRFSSFPYKAVNNQNLHVFMFRHQRDENGNRCMREWPSGIGNALFGLRALYLGSNDIRTVTDKLSYLIYNLDISDNPNISIDVSSICPYIAARAFNLIYSPGQDIRGCDAYLDL